MSTVISGIPCHALTLTPFSFTVRGKLSTSIGKSSHALIRHLPVGSAICPDQRYLSVPSLVNVLFDHSIICTTVSTSLAPSLNSETVKTVCLDNVSMPGKFLSWNNSTFVVLPKFNSGVSLKVRI